MQSQEKWKEVVPNVEAVAASPYTKEDELSEAIDILKDSGADIIVMDCMGYTGEMKEEYQKKQEKWLYYQEL